MNSKLYNTILFILVFIGISCILISAVFQFSCYFSDKCTNNLNTVEIISNNLINQTCIQDTGYIDECYCVFKTYNGTWLCSVEYTYVNYTDALNKYNDIDYDKLKVYGENNGVCKTEHTDYTYYYSLAYYLLAGGILSIFTCCITVYKYESMYQMHRRSMAEQEGMSP